MTGSAKRVQESEQVSAIRAFNRFYTARLGLLQKRHLNGEFSLTEGRILYEIWASPRLTASTLRGTLRLDRGYISRLLASLMKRKLVRQAVSKFDSREKLLTLTSAGEWTVAELNRRSAAQIQDLLDDLSSEERESLVRSLDRARSLLARDSDSAVRVARLPEVTEEALGLLEEYYEAVGVLVRDTPDAVRKIVEDPNDGVWIAYLNGKAVGCAYLRGLPSIPRATECKRLYVKPSARGKGVAHALLDAQEDFARRRGLERIYLDSKDDLKVAIDLYAKRGYRPCKRYNENPQATVFMVKDIRDESQGALRASHQATRKRA